MVIEVINKNSGFIIGEKQPIPVECSMEVFYFLEVVGYQNGDSGASFQVRIVYNSGNPNNWSNRING